MDNLKRIENYKFSPELNIHGYDDVIIDEDETYITFIKRDITKTPVIHESGELMYYDYHENYIERRYKLDRWSGIYYEF